MKLADSRSVLTCAVTGATSPVGGQLVNKLIADNHVVHAISRRTDMRDAGLSCTWHRWDLTHAAISLHFSAQILFHVASIWLLPDRIEYFHDNGVQHIIAFSSTSRFSKANSSSPAERAVAESLARAEDTIANTCERLGIIYTIFRPTLIYGDGKDRNIREIAAFAKRFGVFPILGKGIGLRQPVHINDLVQACISAYQSSASFNRIYDLSGGETLTYREMVERVFEAMGKQARIVSVPKSVFRLAVRLAQLSPRFRHLKPEMAVRMDQDLSFDHQAAVRDFGYSPRRFCPDKRALGLR